MSAIEKTEILTKEEILSNIRELYLVNQTDAETIMELGGAIWNATKGVSPHLIQAALISAQAGIYTEHKLGSLDNILNYRNMMVGFYRYTFDVHDRPLAS